MKSYYRVMCGQKCAYLDIFMNGSCIAVHYGIDEDLTNQLPDDWRLFNQKFRPVYLKNNPGKTKVAAGLACGAIHTVSKGIQRGDLVLTPDCSGDYLVGEVIGDYEYHPEVILPHQRPVKWFEHRISRADMSEALSRSLVTPGTVSSLSPYAEEIERLLAGISAPKLTVNDADVEDPSAFAMEKHLEDFLVENWRHTPFGEDYDIYEVDGELVGQQFMTDTGAIDILAISKNQQTLLVIELKKGRASDAVVGQILRYMGFVKGELAEPDQDVKGVIIAMEDDIRLQRALMMVNDVDFYRYEVRFRLKKV